MYILAFVAGGDLQRTRVGYHPNQVVLNASFRGFKIRAGNFVPPDDRDKVLKDLRSRDGKIVELGPLTNVEDYCGCLCLLTIAGNSVHDGALILNIARAQGV